MKTIWLETLTDANSWGPHETFRIIRPYLEANGIRIHAFENRDQFSRAYLVSDDWKWLIDLGWLKEVVLEGTSIVVIGGTYRNQVGNKIVVSEVEDMAFDLCDPDSLPKLVEYLNELGKIGQVASIHA